MAVDDFWRVASPVPIPDPPNVAYMASLFDVVYSGEFVFFENFVSVDNRRYNLARFIGMSSENTGRFQLLQLASDRPSFAPIQPPISRPHVTYPKEIVLTDIVIKTSITNISGAIFVFSQNDIEDVPDKAVCAGMSNCYVLHFFRTSDEHQRPFDGFLSFPGSSSFSFRDWQTTVRLHWALIASLSTGACNQNTTKNFRISVTPSEWQYIKRRLSPIEVKERVTQISFRVLRGTGATRETIRSRGIKEVLRIDTPNKLELFYEFVGKLATFSYRKKAEKGAKLRAGQSQTVVWQKLRVGDDVNMVTDLTDTEETHWVRCPTKRGIDLVYSSTDNRLSVAVRFQHVKGGDTLCSNVIQPGPSNNIEPAGQNDDSEQEYTSLVKKDGFLEFANGTVYQIIDVNANGVVSCRVFEVPYNVNDIRLGDVVEFTLQEAARAIEEELNRG